MKVNTKNKSLPIFAAIYSLFWQKNNILTLLETETKINAAGFLFKFSLRDKKTKQTIQALAKQKPKQQQQQQSLPLPSSQIHNLENDSQNN